TINGDGGSDALAVDDSGDTAGNSATLTSGTLTGLGMSSGIRYATLEVLTISLGSGGDSFTVEGTRAATNLGTRAGRATINVRGPSAALTITAGLGDDLINVGSRAPAAGGVADGVDGLLTVNGDGGSDALTVDDSGDTAANAGALTATTLTGLGMAA